MSEASSLWLTWYGDDFSGSADSLEALARAGVPAALFLSPPTEAQMARYPGLRAVGVAGVSRSLTVEQMNAELPPILSVLGRLRAPIVHYKLCSTFDSSPKIGSIGRAIELGLATLATSFAPLVVGAPVLGRYCVFGNLFARSGAESPVFRLDRHPTMSCHPVTPMTESDLRVVLAQQTSCPVGLIDAVALDGFAQVLAAKIDQEIAEPGKIVLFDTVNDRHLSTIGEHLSRLATISPPLFVAGSSAVEYALVRQWRSVGWLPLHASCPPVQPSCPVLIVSGSCSPVTARQIERAREASFVEVPLPPEAWLGEDDMAKRAYQEVLDRVLSALAARRHAVVHSALGPSDERIAAGLLDRAARLGRALAALVKSSLHAAPFRRLVIAGGDTSGHVARHLGIESLRFVAPLAPGSPLCRATASDPSTPVDGLEVVFKGGQVGGEDFFLRAAGMLSPEAPPPRAPPGRARPSLA